jgi:hypothetical protein
VQVTRPGEEFHRVETQSSNRLLLISPPGGECAGYIIDDTGRDV